MPLSFLSLEEVPGTHSWRLSVHGDRRMIVVVRVFVDVGPGDERAVGISGSGDGALESGIGLGEVCSVKVIVMEDMVHLAMSIVGEDADMETLIRGGSAGPAERVLCRLLRRSTGIEFNS